MKKIKFFATKTLGFMMMCTLAILISCGSDDDDNGTTETQETQQEEDGPVSTSPTVIVNNTINNIVTVINRNTRIENNNFRMSWSCSNVAPVVHKQFIHISVRCPTLAQDDLNGDNVLDEVEVQQVVGPRVLPLDENIASSSQETFPTGTSYSYDESIEIPLLRQFVPAGQDFIVMFHGVDPSTPIPTSYARTSGDPVHITVPVACMVFKAADDSDTGTTTGTTTGGSTTGDTTTGDTTTGDTTTGDTEETPSP